MALATRRVLVLALCVVSVTLAGVMFPAAGFGDVPSLGSGPATGSSPAPDTGTSGSGPGDESVTDTPGPTAVEPSASTATIDETGGRASTTTATGETASTPTATPTPTATSTPGGPAGDDAGPVAVLGLPVWVLVGWVLLVVTPGIALEGKHRRWPVFRRLPIPAVSVVSLGQSIPQLTSALLVNVSGSVAGLATGLGTVATGGSRAFVVVASSLTQGVGTLAVSLPGALVGSIPSFSGFSLFGRSGTTLGSDTGTSDGATLDRDDPDAVDEETPPATVEAAWAAMVESLHVGNRETKTPMELAERAVDSGLPPDPVYALTDAFRQVAYGGATPTEERTGRALSALERIRRALEGEE